MMVYFSELATAFMTALVLENLLFTRAIDIPSLYEKRTPGQIILIGSVLTGIIAVCSIPSYFSTAFWEASLPFPLFDAGAFDPEYPGIPGGLFSHPPLCSGAVCPHRGRAAVLRRPTASPWAR